MIVFLIAALAALIVTAAASCGSSELARMEREHARPKHVHES